MDAPSTTRPPAWVTAVCALLTLVVTGHLAATFLWLAPDNPVSRSVADPLEGYMEPFFQQNWSLFAPEPISVANSLEVRAFDEDLEPTPWTDVTAIEMTNLTHEVFPSRASRPTRMLAARAKAQFAKLADSELAVLGGHYHDDAWPRLREALLEADGGSSVERIDLVLRYDRAMAAYATEFARATAADDADLRFVQFRVVQQRARTFAARGGELPDPTVYTFGRRPLYEYPGQDSAAFRSAIERFSP